MRTYNSAHYNLEDDCDKFKQKRWMHFNRYWKWFRTKLQSISYRGNGRKQLHKEYFLSNDMFILNFRVQFAECHNIPNHPELYWFRPLSILEWSWIVILIPYNNFSPCRVLLIQARERRFLSKRRSEENVDYGLPSSVGARDFLLGGKEVASVARAMLLSMRAKRDLEDETSQECMQHHLYICCSR